MNSVLISILEPAHLHVDPRNIEAKGFAGESRDIPQSGDTYRNAIQQKSF
jgi:hypothetical protein